MLERRLVLPHAIADKLVVVHHPGEQLDPAALIQWLIARMPRFMVRRCVEFADEIPKTEATVRAQEMRLRVDPRSTRTPGTGRRQASYRIDRNAAVHGYSNRCTHGDLVTSLGAVYRVEYRDD